MLVLTRKVDESITVGTNITVTVLEIRGNQVRLGIEAPKQMPVHRTEVFRSIVDQNMEAAKTPQDLSVRLKTSRFGEIEIDQTRALHFAEGILGFPEQKKYVLLEHKPGSPFCWLQSMESPDLAFVMVDPLIVKPKYLEGLSPSDRRWFETEEGVPKAVFALVTIPPGRVDRMTANLLGPVVIDLTTRAARQVILANSGYSHHHPFFLS